MKLGPGRNCYVAEVAAWDTLPIRRVRSTLTLCTWRHLSIYRAPSPRYQKEVNLVYNNCLSRKQWKHFMEVFTVLSRLWWPIELNTFTNLTFHVRSHSADTASLNNHCYTCASTCEQRQFRRAEYTDRPMHTGVRCNCVRHAILSAPDSPAYAIVSGATHKLFSRHVHD